MNNIVRQTDLNHSLSLSLSLCIFLIIIHVCIISYRCVSVQSLLQRGRIGSGHYTISLQIVTFTIARRFYMQLYASLFLQMSFGWSMMRIRKDIGICSRGIIVSGSCDRYHCFWRSYNQRHHLPVATMKTTEKIVIQVAFFKGMWFFVNCTQCELWCGRISQIIRASTMSAN